MSGGVRLGLVELDDVVVARDLHVDDLVLDLLDDAVLVAVRVDLLQGDDLAGEGRMGALVETQEDLSESPMAQLQRLAEVYLLVFLDAPQLQLPAQFLHHNYKY
jgi:hypothetical protein